MSKTPLQRREIFQHELARLGDALYSLSSEQRTLKFVWSQLPKGQDGVMLPWVSKTGGEQWLLSTADEVISQEIFLRGEFDFRKLTRALEFLDERPRRVLLDVGSNIGSICIPAVHRGLFENAIAVEASPGIVKSLKRNIEINSLKNRISVVEGAAAAISGMEVHLNFDKVNHGATAVAFADNLVPKDGAIKTIALNDLPVDPNEVGLVFMDIEGFECHALLGASEFLNRKVPVVIEFAPALMSKAGSTVQSLIELFRGYSGFVSLNDPLSRKLPISDLHKTWQSYFSGRGPYSTDLLFTP